jgi:hypothetical protein
VLVAALSWAQYHLGQGTASQQDLAALLGLMRWRHLSPSFLAQLPGSLALLAQPEASGATTAAAALVPLVSEAVRHLAAAWGSSPRHAAALAADAPRLRPRAYQLHQPCKIACVMPFPQLQRWAAERHAACQDSSYQGALSRETFHDGLVFRLVLRASSDLARRHSSLALGLEVGLRLGQQPAALCAPLSVWLKFDVWVKTHPAQHQAQLYGAQKTPQQNQPQQQLQQQAHQQQQTHHHQHHQHHHQQHVGQHYKRSYEGEVVLEGPRCGGVVWLEDFFGLPGEEGEEGEEGARSWERFLWSSKLVVGCEVLACE